ncbi:DNAJ heat shock N-terminal domain-containing protein [Seminavis robusta]|uniref:DNAJ heat shock N-terminal domain-containing protein n=1 Tax=Seminavis robusta TaxID=568900 RepID=A0A9N8H5A3_9STRA|nr:DNAJ heat shock N-terminal domain-containing protein [Seminavis robusta]|eukprot:Sro81_g043480.1 DNAJ heat shock N-terminal domain-containing protein (346) ;mRNA; r:54940-56096
MSKSTTISLLLVLALCDVDSFTARVARRAIKPSSSLLSSGKGWEDEADSNTWLSPTEEVDDWEAQLRQQRDGWSAPPTSPEDSANRSETDETEKLLDALTFQEATEVSFNIREAERADKVRQMEEWGFERSTIASALEVAVKEQANDEMESMQRYLEESYLDTDDAFTVESHTTVPRDPDTNESIRSQMVFVDEHACIGCTNCAAEAPSTFFMEEENGRARVFEQWGDSDDAIQIAIDTCPVDCIHYVPFEELMRLEVQRRDQHINVLAGLVSRAERGAGSGIFSLTPRSFGSKAFTDAPPIDRNYYDRDEVRAELEAKEKIRRFADRRRRLEEERRRDNKIVDL